MREKMEGNGRSFVKFAKQKRTHVRNGEKKNQVSKEEYRWITQNSRPDIRTAKVQNRMRLMKDARNSTKSFFWYVQDKEKKRIGISVAQWKWQNCGQLQRKSITQHLCWQLWKAGSRSRLKFKMNKIWSRKIHLLFYFEWVDNSKTSLIASYGA